MKSVSVPECLFVGNVAAYLHLIETTECRVSIQRPGSSNIQGAQIEAVLLSIDEYNRLVSASQQPEQPK